jgi:hypothetical protein
MVEDMAVAAVAGMAVVATGTAVAGHGGGGNWSGGGWHGGGSGWHGGGHGGGWSANEGTAEKTSKAVAAVRATKRIAIFVFRLRLANTTNGPTS